MRFEAFLPEITLKSYVILSQGASIQGLVFRVFPSRWQQLSGLSRDAGFRSPRGYVLVLVVEDLGVYFIATWPGKAMQTRQKGFSTLHLV